MNQVALPTTVTDIVEEYNEKISRIDSTISDFMDAYEWLNMECTVKGNFVDNITSRPFIHKSNIEKNLLASGWNAVYQRLNIESVATAKDKQLFKVALKNPPELTVENAAATFGDYLIRPRYHVLRGLAEVFTSLDPAYKSHSKVKIGVDGLPKRVILHWGEYNSSYGFEKFRDIVNALAAFQDIPPMDWYEVREVEASLKYGDVVLDGKSFKWKDKDELERSVDRGITVRKFKNGNAHVIFSKWTLFDINKALNEFYGDVLPDVEEENPTKRQSTEVAKDLQFYWTPTKVVTAACDFAGIYDPADYGYGRERPSYRVLEPSCGDGKILDVLRERGCETIGVEYHEGRASICKANGHTVVTANFLELEPTGDFDFVIMNPPFYGRHYIKHVNHAMKFLRDGGILVSILPATAHYDHGELNGSWTDLPVASFSEAGTNVPTGMMKMIKR